MNPSSLSPTRPIEATATAAPESTIVSNQRAFFRQGHTRSIEARQDALRKLKAALEAHQDQLMAAIHQDFRKPAHEATLEIIPVLEEIDVAIKRLPGWARARHVSTPLIYQPSSAMILPEPLGVALVVSPWNYPVYLSLIAVVSAIAAGNTVVLKPSELSPHSSEALRAMVESHFDPTWFTVMLGGPKVTQGLIDAPVDYIFFTGSPTVGKLIMAAAAKHLTPVTLELGGKSPVIIDDKVSLESVARRVLWSKCFNAGQTCVAGDYVLIPSHRREELYQHLRAQVTKFYGDHPQKSPDYPRIINDRNFERLRSMITGKVVVGGDNDPQDRYIAPTVIEVDDPTTHPAMQEEIFGPILPVLSYNTLEEAIAFVNERPKPLVLYLFTNNSSVRRKVMGETSSGSFVVNDLIIQTGLSELPFGGVGNSGMGTSHGEKGFDTFSHFKSVMKRSLLLDTPMLYPPYKTSISLLKTLARWFG